MVSVKIKRDHNRIVSFTISGHADAGPHGHDLVCAGVSTVSTGTYNAVEKLCGVTMPVELGEHGGFFHCVVPEELEKNTDEKVQLLLEGMAVSLKTIEIDYGKYIQIKEF